MESFFVRRRDFKQQNGLKRTNLPQKMRHKYSTICNASSKVHRPAQNQPPPIINHQPGKVLLAAIVYGEPADKFGDNNRSARASVKCDRQGQVISSGASNGSKVQTQHEESADKSPGLLSRLFSPSKGKHQRKRPLDSNNVETPATRSPHAVAGDQVIEFKFDLIVEQQHSNGAGQRLMPGKLSDSVNELIESFVLKSQDVCLMVTGNEEFDYLARIALHTLTYGFELMLPKGSCQKKLANENNGQQLNMPVAALESSIELSGMLFMQDFEGNKFKMIDLFDCTINSERLANSEQLPFSNLAPVDCFELSEALEAIQRLQDNFESSSNENSAINLLVINLKLKRRIDCGLFSNSMSLVSFDPHFEQLNQIFMSIFSGQALTYLKSKKMSPWGAVSAQPPAANQKHKHHQNAYSSIGTNDRLLHHVEWLLYKHLSSALLKTLIIVHVQKLAPSGSIGHDGAPILSDTERRLMADNLILLDFAKLIRKVSTQKLRRRKKHLKSHQTLLFSSNLSLPNGNHQCQHDDANQMMAGGTIFEPTNLGSGMVQSAAKRKSSMNMDLALSRHKRRHLRDLQELRRFDFFDATDRSLHNGAPDSSQSNSSAESSRRRLAKNKLMQQAASQLTATTSFSDTDSNVSANLNNSKQSMLSHRIYQKISQANGKQSSPPSMEMSTFRHGASFSSSSSSATKKNSIIAIDCQSPIKVVRSPRADNVSIVADINDDYQDDNLSDFCCSIISVAEPPKQLRLEEFFGQLNSIIIASPPSASDQQRESVHGADKRSIGSDNVLSGLDQLDLRGPPTQQQAGYSHFTTETNRAAPYEDDEDCKSHSSILEHLASLALESNTKLNNRSQPLAGQDVRQADNGKEAGHSQMLPTAGNRSLIPAPKAGQQQQKLSSLEDRLKALSVSCQQEQQQSASPSSSSTSSAFVSSSSTDSSCCSSLSSSGAAVVDGARQLATANNGSLFGVADESRRKSNLYASVLTKSHKKPVAGNGCMDWTQQKWQ